MLEQPEVNATAVVAATAKTVRKLAFKATRAGVIMTFALSADIESNSPGVFFLLQPCRESVSLVVRPLLEPLFYGYGLAFGKVFFSQSRKRQNMLIPNSLADTLLLLHLETTDH
jgi:hypothetical protein